MLGFFRNNFGFGGNNGLTDFKTCWLQRPGPSTRGGAVRHHLRGAGGPALMMCRAIVTSSSARC